MALWPERNRNPGTLVVRADPAARSWIGPGGDTANNTHTHGRAEVYGDRRDGRYSDSRMFLGHRYPAASFIPEFRLTHAFRLTHTYRPTLAAGLV
jgi:hypothetical protein